MVLALVNYSTAPLPAPRKLSLEAYTAFLSDYIQEFRKLLLVLARKAAELEQRGVDARKAAASLEAEHRSLGNALNERLLLKHRTSAHISRLSPHHQQRGGLLVLHSRPNSHQASGLLATFLHSVCVQVSLSPSSTRRANHTRPIPPSPVCCARFKTLSIFCIPSSKR
jgi:hypothetical protein